MTEIGKKRYDSMEDNKKLRRAKRLNVATSLSSGAMGLGGLGALGAAAASKNPRVINRYRQAKFTRPGTSEKLNRRAAVLTTGAAGVGGAGSLNFAAVQHREANQLTRKIGDKKVRKSYVRKEHAVSNDWSPGIDFGLNGVHQGRNVISKAYDPEKNRQKRLDAYSVGSAAGAGAAATGSALYGRKAYRSGKMANMRLNAAGTTGGPQSATAVKGAVKHGKNAVKSGGKSGALGLTALGLGAGAMKIENYKRERGRSYSPRSF
jgi:hypothetical protein